MREAASATLAAHARCPPSSRSCRITSRSWPRSRTLSAPQSRPRGRCASAAPLRWAVTCSAVPTDTWSGCGTTRAGIGLVRSATRLAQERWLERTRARLIDCAHWHVIFTIPHQLNVLWQLNTAVMMDALFAAARDTLLELLADPRYLGAQPGIQLALHTWSRATGAAPAPALRWSATGACAMACGCAPRRSHFLPAKVVMLLFRGKLLDALRSLHRRGQLRLPDAHERRALREPAQPPGAQGQVERARVQPLRPRARGEPVPGPLRQGRAVRQHPDRARQPQREVLFRYTPHTEAGQPKRSATLALAPERFLARVLQHAPEPGRHTVRYYGLYAHACAEQLNAARALHQQAARRAARSRSTGRAISRASRARWPPRAARSVTPRWCAGRCWWPPALRHEPRRPP